MTYAARTFNLPELKGISKKQIEVHLALYEGYVKHTNVIIETIERLRKEDAEKNAFLMNELRRRMGFEFDGMRMHEYYFEQFEGGTQAIDSTGVLFTYAEEKYGSWDGFFSHIKEVAGTRGIGWVVVYFDQSAKSLHTAFVNDHEIGQFSGTPIVLALDLWEHAYMVDYLPKDKKTYVDAFLENVNWLVVDLRAQKATR